MVFKSILTNMIHQAGSYLQENAEAIAGDLNKISDFTIELSFTDSGILKPAPEITIIHTHLVINQEGK